jgi:hypothetical protein
MAIKFEKEFDAQYPNLQRLASLSLQARHPTMPKAKFTPLVRSPRSDGASQRAVFLSAWPDELKGKPRCSV